MTPGTIPKPARVMVITAKGSNKPKPQPMPSQGYVSMRPGSGSLDSINLSRTSSQASQLSNEDPFPSLPQKPKRVSVKQLRGNIAPSSSWTQSEPEEAQPESSSTDKGKKKKQVLMRWG